MSGPRRKHAPQPPSVGAAGLLLFLFLRCLPANIQIPFQIGKKGVAVLDRSASIGGTAPLAAEVKSVLYSLEQRVPVQEYIFGLGGRDFYASDARTVFERMMKNDYRAGARFIGLLERGGEDVRD